jgi:hypothetical protein
MFPRILVSAETWASLIQKLWGCVVVILHDILKISNSAFYLSNSRLAEECLGT